MPCQQHLVYDSVFTIGKLDVEESQTVMTYHTFSTGCRSKVFALQGTRHGSGSRGLVSEGPLTAKQLVHV